MSIKRVGILPDIDDSDAPHLHRAAVIVTRSAHDMPRYGYAVAGHLAQEAMVARLPDVAACVVWGCNEDKVASVLKRNAHATMIVVLLKRPTKNGLLMGAMETVADKGSCVEVVVVGTKTKAQAWDVGVDHYCKRVTDLRRPPQQQQAPTIPMRFRKRPTDVGEQAPSSKGAK